MLETLEPRVDGTVDDRVARRGAGRDRSRRRDRRTRRCADRRSSAPARAWSTATSDRSRRSRPTARSSTPRSSTRCCSSTAGSIVGPPAHRLADRPARRGRSAPGPTPRGHPSHASATTAGWSSPDDEEHVGARDHRVRRDRRRVRGASPPIHGDERGIFIETYRREWFPHGPRDDPGQPRRTARRAPSSACTTTSTRPTTGTCPMGSARVVLHDLREGGPDRRRHARHRPRREARRHARPPRRVHPAGRRARVRRAERHGDHLPGRRLLQPRATSSAWPGTIRRSPPTGASPNPTLSERDQANPARADLPAAAVPTGRCAREQASIERRSMTRRILVTGGAGFIGSNYVRHVLATTDDAVTVYDALTYAGQPLHAARRRRRSALPVREGQHLRPRDASRTRCAGTTRSCTSPPRATSTVRSSVPTTSSTPTASAPTS